MIPLQRIERIDHYKLMQPPQDGEWIHLGCFDVDQSVAEIRFHSLTIDSESSEERCALVRQLVEGSPWKVMTGASGDTECCDRKRMGRIVFKRDFIWLYPPKPWWRILWPSTPRWRILGVYRLV